MLLLIIPAVTLAVLALLLAIREARLQEVKIK